MASFSLYCMLPPCSPKMSTNFQQTTHRYISEDKLFTTTAMRDLKPYKYDYFARTVV
jgi:hypothetical protein